MAALAQKCGLAALADEHLSVPTDKGSNAGAKVTALVAGMVAGADSIDDMGLLRHGAMGTVFDRPYAPSTLGSFLREFAFGHVRQLDAVASRLLARLARTHAAAGRDRRPRHGRSRRHHHRSARLRQTRIRIRLLRGPRPQCADRHGHHRRRRTGDHRPAAAQRRLRLPARSGPDDRRHPGHRGTAALARGHGASRWCGRIQRSTAIRPWPRRSAAAPRCRSPCAWTRKSKPRSPTSTTMPGPRSNTPTPSTTKPPTSGSPGPRSPRSRSPRSAPGKPPSRSPGRLVVRRIPDLNPAPRDGQQSLFDTWRFHAFFTTTDLDTVTADKTHRGHAIIEQVHADLKNSALAHLPSGRFAANAAWLVLAVIAFNLTRAAATLTGPRLARARTATIRRTLITVPARDRVLGPPPDPAPTEGLALGTSVEHPVPQPVSPKSAAHRLTLRPHQPFATKDPQEQPDTEVRRSSMPIQRHNPPQGAQSKSTSHRRPLGRVARGNRTPGLPQIPA